MPAKLGLAIGFIGLGC